MSLMSHQILLEQTERDIIMQIDYGAAKKRRISQNTASENIY
jgi:hypothetical protein